MPPAALRRPLCEIVQTPVAAGSVCPPATDLADAHGDGQRLQLLVKGDQHARLQRRRQTEQQVVRLAQDH